MWMVLQDKSPDALYDGNQRISILVLERPPVNDTLVGGQVIVKWRVTCEVTFRFGSNCPRVVSLVW
jgi:hypothetical protein